MEEEQVLDQKLGLLLLPSVQATMLPHVTIQACTYMRSPQSLCHPYIQTMEEEQVLDKTLGLLFLPSVQATMFPHVTNQGSF